MTVISIGVDTLSIIGNANKTIVARSMKIYTRTGDKGSSALFTGERRPKTDEVFHALGTIDELSSSIGLALAHLAERQGSLRKFMTQNPNYDLERLRQQLLSIQCRLQDLGSCVATPIPNVPDTASEKEKIGVRSKRHSRANFPAHAVPQELEPWIDEMTVQLKPLRKFVLPSGGVVATSLHVARTICRRAEREIVAVNEARTSVGDSLAVEVAATTYINRLSDYLFTAARFAAEAFCVPEEPYKKLN
ncbi:unnamed protein product [Schistocephalus solidus]|uniref:Corrinoid adenosyltransferase MMAB n=1 Tax=Schistocephalus solidus TaxID=70667 RepID=A0A183TQ63_SCHSO|nr:unnamed protein product [Schistocephalus solidus]